LLDASTTVTNNAGKVTTPLAHASVNEMLGEFVPFSDYRPFQLFDRRKKNKMALKWMMYHSTAFSTEVNILLQTYCRVYQW